MKRRVVRSVPLAPRTGALVVACALLLAPAWVAAQDAARGARLYLQLPGDVGSCVECHGPDPALDRNRLLNGADGAAAITLAIARAAPMGYLDDILSDVDRADLSAYLARVRLLVNEPRGVAVWPRTVEFGRLQAGAAVAVQRVWLRNLGDSAVTFTPPAVDHAALSLVHDCPSVLPAGAQCRADLSVATGSAQNVLAALQWQAAADWAPQWVGVAARIESGAAGGALVPDLPSAAVALDAVVGERVAREFDLVNAGSAVLSLGVPTLTGPESRDFSVVGSVCANSLRLLPGERCRVRVSFTPARRGTAQAALQWRSDGTALPTLELRGSAVDAPSVPPPAPPPDPSQPPTTPPPLPVPEAPPAPVVGGGSGGCRMALQPGDLDPTLPLVLALAAWAAARRRVARLPSN